MNQESSPQVPASALQLRGVLGGGVARPGKANLRLIRKAIRDGWDIPEATRQALVDHLEAVALSGHPRNVIAAAWCLLEAVRANRYGMKAGIHQPGQSEGVSAS